MDMDREDANYVMQDSDSGTDRDQPPSDLENLERLKNNMFKRLCAMYSSKGNDCKKYNHTPKVGDLVKIIELQRRLSSDSKAEEQFWEIIERLRQEELNRG
jgi:hypothetical protein